MSLEDSLALAKRDIESRRAGQADQFAREVGQVRAEMNARGVLHSSMTAFRLADLSGAAISYRVTHAVNAVQRALTASALGYVDGLAEKLKQFIHDAVPPAQPDLRPDKTHLDHLEARVNETINDSYAQAIQRAETELDYFVMALKNRVPAQVVQNISISGGNFGAAQFGAHSTATVNMGLNLEDRARIEQLVEQARQIVAQRGTEFGQRDEVLRTIEDVQRELKQEKPSTLKLRGLLAACKGAVEVMAALQPASEFIGTALSYLT